MGDCAVASRSSSSKICVHIGTYILFGLTVDVGTLLPSADPNLLQDFVGKQNKPSLWQQIRDDLFILFHFSLNMYARCFIFLFEFCISIK